MTEKKLAESCVCVFFLWELFSLSVSVNVVTICALGSVEANKNKGKMYSEGISRNIYL
jgi:hypothetical protein